MRTVGCINAYLQIWVEAGSLVALTAIKSISKESRKPVFLDKSPDCIHIMHIIYKQNIILSILCQKVCCAVRRIRDGELN